MTRKYDGIIIGTGQAVPLLGARLAKAIQNSTERIGLSAVECSN